MDCTSFFKFALVVEGNDQLRRLFGIQLNNHGFKVEYAENGAEAVSKAQERHYSLIVIDVYMPQNDGIEAVAQIRANTASRPEKIRILSTSSDYELRAKLLKAGADEFVAKPLLFEKLDTLLSSS